MYVYVRGFAATKSQIEMELSSHTLMVIEHLLKIYLMPYHSAVNHWKSEIASNIYEVDKLKNTKKFPTAKQIYGWTYGRKQDKVTDIRWFSRYARQIINEYGERIETDASEYQQEFNNICVSYFSWLADRLSVDGDVRFDEIYEKLDSIFQL